MPSDKIQKFSSDGIILNLSYGAFIRDVGQYVIWVIMSVYLNEVRSLSYVSIGVVFLIGGFLSVPLSILGGNLIDRIGRRKLAILIPWLMSALSLGLFAMIYYDLNLLVLLALFIISGPMESLQYVTMSTIIADVTSESERISGYSALRIASNLGIGIGLVVGGFLSQFNYAFIFLLSFGGYVSEGVLYYFRIPETSPSTAVSKGEHQPKRKIVLPFRDTFFIAISLITSFGWFFTGMFESALTPLYMSSVNHFNPFSITILFAINSAVVIAFQTPINKLLRNVRDSLRIILGLMLYSLAYLIFAETSFYLVIAMAAVLLTFGENIASPASTSLITKIAPEKNRGSYLGFNSSIASLINPFRPLVGTFLLSATVAEPSLSWIVLSMASFLIALLFLVLFRRISQRRNSVSRSPL